MTSTGKAKTRSAVSAMLNGVEWMPNQITNSATKAKTAMIARCPRLRLAKRLPALR